MAIIKKSRKKLVPPQPTINLPVAKLKVMSVEMQDAPKDVTTKSGETFTSEPNLLLELMVTDDFADGGRDGTRFFDRFKMKWDDELEDYTVTPGSKLGGLCRARYGEDFFDDENDDELNSDDFLGFEFQARVQPKTNPRTNVQVSGSTVHYETITPVPISKKKVGTS